MTDANDSFERHPDRHDVENVQLRSSLTKTQRQELDRRLAAYKASCDPGLTWEQVEARLNESR